MALYHTTLQIVRGVLKAPGDQYSAENDLFTIELQDPQGLDLQLDGWSPQLPTLKGGGTWAESAIADGRTPLAQPVGNVTETMRLTMANVDLTQRFAMFKKLGLMRQSVIDFWTGSAQIDPVYIKWHAAIGKGEQYALIYNLEVAQESDIFDVTMPWDITLTIEREPYWRGLWPGANPKEWTLGVVRGHVRGSALFDLNDMRLARGSSGGVATTDHFIYVTDLPNRHEWQAADDGDHYIAISQNYIEINGSTIPGDAPALLQLNIDDYNPSVLSKFGSVFIALSSKETSRATRDSISGPVKANAYLLAAGDADVSVGVKTAGNADNGVISNNSNSQQYYVQSTNTATITWGPRNAAGATILRLDRELLRGTFLVFVRGNQVTAGAAGDITLSLSVNEIETGAATLIATQSFPSVNLPLNTTYPELAYIGRLTIPFASRSAISLLGYGRQVRGSAGNLEFILTVTHVTASKTARIVDVILMPLDEWLVEVREVSISGTVGPTELLIDNTGYLSHGLIELIGKAMITSNIESGGVSAEIRGQGFTLLPGKIQRLYFLFQFAASATGQIGALPSISPTIRGNIIPRWTGIRDV